MSRLGQSLREGGLSIQACSFFIIPFSFPFCYVARSLKMFEVRSSDQEMGLPSSNDRVILEASSPSTPYKASNISCSFTGRDEQRIKDKFQFPDSVKIRIPSDKERLSFLC